MSKDRRHVSLPVVSRTPRCDEPAEPHPDEFRPGASVWDSRFSRRSFLQTMTASLALAGLYGCSDRPSEAIVPYVDPPEQVVPGEPLFFASTLTRGGYGRGVLVTSHEGRPTKIEGNPDHPASLGAADVGMQADVLSLYDPKRSQTVTHAGQASTWGKLIETLNQHLARTGDGLCVLTGACTSPTLIDQLDQLRLKYPSAAFFSSEPIDRSNTRRGAQLAFGQLAEPIYHLDRCDVIVALDSDFLWDEPGSLPYARQFADRRRTHANGLSMSRLYAAEGNFSVTGSKADHRLPATPAQVARLAQALLNSLQNGQALTDPPPAHARWLAAAVADLQAARGRSLIVVGESQPPEIHALAAAVNQQLGNVGKTVEWIPPVVDPRGGNLRDLVQAIHRGEVRTLLMLCENPVRHSPNDIPLAEALQQLSTALASDGSYQNFVLHHGLYANETAYVSQWHVPAHHALESWSDARAFDGTASIVQPLIAPLYASRSPGDLISLLLDGPHRSPYECVRRYWQSQTGIHQPDAFETWWNRVLQRGVIDGTRAQPIPVSQAAAPALGASTVASSTGLVLLLRPDYSVWDGSAFHNPWLQELPRPLSKIVWGNAALLGPATAAKYGVVEQDVIRLSAGGSSVEVPAVLIPGIADDAIVLHLGYGQHKLFSQPSPDELSPADFGVNAYRLQTQDHRWASPVTLERTGRQEKVVRTHNHHAMAADNADATVKASLTPQVLATPSTSDEDLKLHNRRLIRAATLDERRRDPDFVRKMDEKVDSLYNVWDYSKGEQWGMTIDLTACIGCNACVIACQAENNIPVVGRDQVDREREMHWIRIDDYFEGPKESPRVYHQPVPCMHCENAPCEYVCPVAATSHSVDGLNQMTYNRCVGTRYCSNNCPYKVRRFNFYNYTAGSKKTLGEQRNPDVTVRTRGVMEKCSYCVQRIVYARRKSEIAQLDAEAQGRTDDVVHPMFERLETACQQTCPTRAIAFGDLHDPKTEVTRLKADPMNYGLLEELTTKPRTTYLAHLHNPNPSLESNGGSA